VFVVDFKLLPFKYFRKAVGVGCLENSLVTIAVVWADDCTCKWEALYCDVQWFRCIS